MLPNPGKSLQTALHNINVLAAFASAWRVGVKQQSHRFGWRGPAATRCSRRLSRGRSRAVSGGGSTWRRSAIKATVQARVATAAGARSHALY